MSNKFKQIFAKYSYIIILYIIASIFFLKLGVGLTFIIFFIISTFIGIYLSRYPNKFAKIVVLLIGIINFFLFVYALIPQPEVNVDIKKFFAEQDNCVKIFKNDPDEVLRKQMASVYIIGKNKKIKFKLWEVENYKKICGLTSQDTIIYTARSKNLKTFLTLYLWDGTIIRIFPKTKLVLDKVIKNLDDLPSSQTKISVNEGSIRFRVIKLITSDEGFNVKTPDGILIIRGTAGYVARDDKTLAYSDDHLIEGRTAKGEKFYIKGKEAVIFTQDKVLKKLDFREFINVVGQNFYQLLIKFKSIDKEELENYRKKLLDYIQAQISNWQKSNLIARLSFWKAKLVGVLKGNESEILNYEKVKLLLGKFSDKDLANIDLSRFKDYLFVPINDKYDELKMRFFEQMSKLNEYWQRNYTIQKINQLLDENKEKATEYINQLFNK